MATDNPNHSPRFLTALREALRRAWSSLWRPHGPGAVLTKLDEKVDTRRGARARFWTELRAGQREAEAHSARLR